MKAKKLKNIYGFGMLILAVGIGILLYPPIASLWTDHMQKEDVAGYVLESKTIPDGSKEEKLREARTYNEQLFEIGAALTAPLGFNEEEASGIKYKETLNLTDIMAVIEIPAINLKLPIYHDTTESVLMKGVGHLRSTSLPVGGENTHCILTAHSGLQSKILFSNINLLEEGDLIAITVYDETIYYEVQGKEIILPTEIDQLQMLPGEDQLTLITCTPFGVNSHRLLVHSKRVYPDMKENMDKSKFIAEQKKTVFTFVNGVEVAFAIPAIYLLFRLCIKFRKLQHALKLRRKYISEW